MKNKWMSRGLAAVLAAAMVGTFVPATAAFADEATKADDITVYLTVKMCIYPFIYKCVYHIRLAP